MYLALRKRKQFTTCQYQLLNKALCGVTLEPQQMKFCVVHSLGGPRQKRIAEYARGKSLSPKTPHTHTYPLKTNDLNYQVYFRGTSVTPRRPAKKSFPEYTPDPHPYTLYIKKIGIKRGSRGTCKMLRIKRIISFPETTADTKRQQKANIWRMIGENE